MIIYTCEKCTYTTKYKSDYKKHLNRKKPCKINIIESANMCGKSKLPHNPSQTVSNPSQKNRCFSLLPHKCEGIKQKSHKFDYICEFCEKIFTRKDNLDRHIIQFCRKKTLGNKIDKITQDLQLVVENQKQVVEYHKSKEKSWNKEREKIYNVIEKISNNSGNIVNNTYNQNNQIIINSYGCENLKYIKGYLNELVKIPFTSVPKLVEKIHCNPQHPENQNVKLTNKKLPYIQVYKDNQWSIYDKKEIISNIVDKSYNLLEEHFYENSDELNSQQLGRFNGFKDKMSYEDDNLNKKIAKDVELCLINNGN